MLRFRRLPRWSKAKVASSLLGLGLVTFFLLFWLPRRQARIVTEQDEKISTESAELAEPDSSKADATPSAQPKVPPKPVKSFNREEIKQCIINEFAELGDVAVKWALRVANCESGYNPYAKSLNGKWFGLFQFVPRTFYANGGKNIWDYKDQIRVTKDMYKRNQQHQWGCR